MPNATVRAKARTAPKATKRRTPTNARRRPVDHPVATLSFVASRDGKTLPKAKKGQKGRCFWNVKPTGYYEYDNLIGKRLALEYLEFEKTQGEHRGYLQMIVADMPRKLTGVEVAFLSMVSMAAGAGFPHFRLGLRIAA